MSRSPSSPAAPDNNVGVLLLHGITGAPQEMRPLAQHLQGLGYLVETPVLAGHGAGCRELLATTWEDWLAGVRAATDALAAKCSGVVVVGLSAAALLGTLVAVERPSVRGASLLAVHLSHRGDKISRVDYAVWRMIMGIPYLRRHWYFHEHPPYGLKDERLQRVITRAIQSSARGETAKFGLFRTYAETIHQIKLLENAARRVAPLVRCPVQLIHSFEDSMLGINNATEMYGLLGTPDKTVELIIGCDHVITIDLCKQDVARRVEQFVARVTSSP